MRGQLDVLREIAHAAGFVAYTVELDAGEVLEVSMERDNGDHLKIIGRWWYYTPWGATLPTIGMDQATLKAVTK